MKKTLLVAAILLFMLLDRHAEAKNYLFGNECLRLDGYGSIYTEKFCGTGKGHAVQADIGRWAEAITGGEEVGGGAQSANADGARAARAPRLDVRKTVGPIRLRLERLYNSARRASGRVIFAQLEKDRKHDKPAPLLMDNFAYATLIEERAKMNVEALFADAGNNRSFISDSEEAKGPDDAPGNWSGAYRLSAVETRKDGVRDCNLNAIREAALQIRLAQANGVSEGGEEIARPGALCRVKLKGPWAVSFFYDGRKALDVDEIYERDLTSRLTYSF